MRILVVDDDPTIALSLEGCLRLMGHDVSLAYNGRQALELIRGGEFRAIITDWEMPELNGPDLCRKIRQRQLSSYIYVILLTGRSEHADLIAGLEAGADDFLTKPFEPEELRVRLRAAERILGLESRDLVIFSLARLAESRDSDTGAHLERIREYCRILADQLVGKPGYGQEIDADYVQTIYLTSPLHDIGKVGIPDSILRKPGRLEPHEFEIMKQHAEIGRETLEAALKAYPTAGFLQVARDIAWTHHERFDGSGYPRGLRGAEIPLCGRIVAVADVYDALTSKRSYKPALEHEVARCEIVGGYGTAFDPRMVDAFLEREADFIATNRRFSTGPCEEAGHTSDGELSSAFVLAKV